MGKYRVDANALRGEPLGVGETRLAARVGGMTVLELEAMNRGDLGQLSVNAMIGIVFVLIRRQYPRFTEADMDGLSWEDIEFVQPDVTGHDGAADPPQPLKPLRSGGRKSSARSVATTA